jgi:ketosteroid isomerase-like protein
MTTSLRFLLVAALVANGLAAAAQTSKPASCSAPEYRQFDFWRGDWDVFESDGVTAAAHVRVDRRLGGCVLHEVYDDPTGLQGESFTIYDASRRVWHQTWVTNRGQLLQIEGRTEGDAVVLTGSYRSATGEKTDVRATWKPVNSGVRETALTSADDGKTWKPWFDLVFRSRTTGQAASADAKAVSSLDTQYQAAVKANDAATMDRLLADDFILVTGSGKTYTKTDLLRDARAGSTSYEHQEDVEQTVRVWGDTAVITAKLWEKGNQGGKPFDSTLWFSDTYVRTPGGWKYVFGQASLPLPKPH